MKDNSAVIVNLTEQSWTLHRSYGTFTVRGAESDAADPDTVSKATGSAAGKRLSRAADAPYTITRVLCGVFRARHFSIPIKRGETYT